jgi:hypothetical protein
MVNKVTAYIITDEKDIYIPVCCMIFLSNKFNEVGIVYTYGVTYSYD